MHRRTLVRLFWLPLLLVLVACMRPASEPRVAGRYLYEVDATTRDLVVEATFDDARTERLALPHAELARDLSLRTEDGWRPAQWNEPSCRSHCTIRYRLDLGALADACKGEVDCARRVDDAVISPALAWLAHPSPKTDVPVTVHVRAPEHAFATGMRPLAGVANTYAFRAYDLDEGSFTAFGPQRRVAVSVREARIDVVLLGPLAMRDSAIATWVKDAGGVVASLFGRFPVDHATLFVVPEPGHDEVVSGKVLSLAGASVVLLVGDQMKEAKQHEDWVLVHELFHLGFPTFRGEGRWLGEGLATYYEPLLRARAGWTTEADATRELEENTQRGSVEGGLAQREDLDSIYWGGARFCLAADERIRSESNGTRSLDDVMRAVLARGGDATHVWTVADVLKLADETTATNVMSDMFERHAMRGEKIAFSTRH